MVRIILHGCSGRMGHIITEICEKDTETQIVAGVDAFGDAYAGYPVYRTLQECPAADVIVDFSTASAVDALLDYSVEKKIPVVVCTTGLSPEQTEKLSEASHKTAGKAPQSETGCPQWNSHRAGRGCQWRSAQRIRFCLRPLPEKREETGQGDRDQRRSRRYHRRRSRCDLRRTG